jgi:DNA-binding IscR family transcriptional regulator
LREALGPERGPAETRSIAEKLRSENPRLRQLIAALREKGLFD